MRGDDDVGLAAVANLTNEPDHAYAGRRVKPIGWLIEKDQPRTVNNCLGQLGQLFHPQ